MAYNTWPHDNYEIKVSQETTLLLFREISRTDAGVHQPVAHCFMTFIISVAPHSLLPLSSTDID